jgi:chloramphenicol 3-O phosphotransferase
VAHGSVVLINGTSSAGKSSMARELQALLDDTYLRLGLDDFIHNLPSRSFVLSNGVEPALAEYFLVVFPDASPGAVIPGENDPAAIERMGVLSDVRIGPSGLRFLEGMYRAVAALAEAGTNVIFDDVIHDPRVLRAAVDALAHLDVLFVGLRLPLAVAEQRERARGDRGPGGAAAFHERVHAHGLYDLELDTSVFSVRECAMQVRDALVEGAPRQAFRQLAARGASPARPQSATGQ